MRRRRYISVTFGCSRGAGAPEGSGRCVFRSPEGISHRKNGISDAFVGAEIPSGERVMGRIAPWVGTAPRYQPTANENIAPPAHQMPSGHDGETHVKL